MSGAMPRRSPQKKNRTKQSGALTLSIDEAVQLGIRLQQQGDVTQAAQIYKHVLSGHPDHVDALHFLGVAEHQLGHNDAALELIERGLALAPGLADLHNNRGNVLKLLGRLDEAEVEYGKVLELRPNDADALNNIGTILRERGHFEHAVEMFRKAIALQPEHYAAYQNLGNALRRLNRLEEALEAHSTALRLRPRHGDAYHQLGAMYYALGRIEDSADIYRLWLGIDPDNPVPRHLLAACTGQGVPPRASDDFIRASFDTYAEHFDCSLGRLEYRAPELVGQAVRVALGDARASLRILDAGCGTGLCAPHLRPYAQHLVGVDLSPKMVERARGRTLYDTLVVSELVQYMDAQPLAFDLVASADTLVYFGPLDLVANAAASALRPNGHFVFTVERSETSEAPDGYRIHPHGRYSHTDQYLGAVLETARLKIAGISRVELRKEAGKWVNGWLVTAIKPGAAT